MSHGFVISVYVYLRQPGDGSVRFIVDHEARVISMSFGKTFSWHREAVDAAVRYAMSRGALVVHNRRRFGLPGILSGIDRLAEGYNFEFFLLT